MTTQQLFIAERILKEIRERLKFLVDVGLDYLTLDRPASTLSGGEGQRIRLATQIGSSLVGVLYILDEPSIGLHPRDNQRLLETLERLRDMGNTVIIVEHDRDTILAGDYVIDLGPGRASMAAISSRREPLRRSARITAQSPADISRVTLTFPCQRCDDLGMASSHACRASENNLRNISVNIPSAFSPASPGSRGPGRAPSDRRAI